jgi:hypothetical protein
LLLTESYDCIKKLVSLHCAGVNRRTTRETDDILNNRRVCRGRMLFDAD